MPLNAWGTRIRNRVTSQLSVMMVVGFLFAIPTAVWFESIARGTADTFFLFTAVAFGAPTAYRDNLPQYDRMLKAVLWTLIGCGVTAIGFIALYVAGTEAAGLPPFLVSLGAFCITFFGFSGLLSLRRN